MLFWKLPRLICKNDEALRKAGVLALMYWSLKKEHDSMEVCTEKQHDWPSILYIWFYKIACIFFLLSNSSMVFLFSNSNANGRIGKERRFWRRLRCLWHYVFLGKRYWYVIYFIVLIDRKHFSYCLICNMFHRVIYQIFLREIHQLKSLFFSITNGIRHCI